MRRTGHLTAREAADALGVSRATLYAYVSRGLVRSEPGERSRERRYRAEDVWMLLQRREGRSDPSRAVAQALHWGTPLLESSLTSIEGERLFYRGHDATDLALTSTFEDVAALLWQEPTLRFPDELPDPPPPRWDGLRGMAGELPPLEAFQLVLTARSAHDPAAWDLTPEGVRRTGARITRLLAAVAVGAEPSRRPIAEVLQRGWWPEHPEWLPLLEATLVLMADHELNVSTFTARCVASARATPYAAVIAGLSALRGAWHGGASEQVQALFEEVGSPEHARTVIERRLRRGDLVPGFGHGVYAGEDPRAELLNRLIREALPDAPELALADAIRGQAEDVIRKWPNVDFAVATLAHAFELPRTAPIALFGIARSVGWIAHVIEQYGEARLIRPRARYVGPLPPR